MRYLLNLTVCCWSW